MAEALAPLIVACPECKKKFKPKTDVRGKKIKCPFCKVPFTVPAAKDKGKPDAKKSGDGKADAAEEKPQAPVDEFDENPDPYGVKHVELVPRCPNCTFEMGEHDTICLKCGYNTLTREWGKTTHIQGLTFGRHLLYLLPALAAAFFTVLFVISQIFFDVIGPYIFDGWLWWLDTEAIRLFSTVLLLAMTFSAGVYSFKKFIDKPKPDDIVLG